MFFIVVIVMIPGYFYYQLKQEDTDVGKVSIQNKFRFFHLINENMRGSIIPAILGQGVEF